MPSSFNLQAEQSGVVNGNSNINNKDINAFAALQILTTSPVSEEASKRLSLTPVMGNAVY